MKNNPYDAILIPGGGLLANGQPYPWIEARLDAAITHFTGKEYLICLSYGTPYKPLPQNEDATPITEAAAGATYLISKGIPPNKVLVESFSKDTLGNAYFARMLDTNPAKLYRLLVITSDFHMARTRRIFEWVMSLPENEASPPYHLDFESVPNIGMDPTIVEARQQKEQTSLDHLETKIIPTISTIRELHHHLFVKHLAYASQTGTFELSPNARKSY